jgi:hypothetical protein
MGEHVLSPETFSKSGEYAVIRRIEAGWPAKGPVQFDFRLDKVLGPTASDQRELGIIFAKASLDAR